MNSADEILVSYPQRSGDSELLPMDPRASAQGSAPIYRPSLQVIIRHLYISSDHNFFGHHEKPPGEHRTVEVQEIECVAGRGIRGDRFFDFKKNYKGQITFFSQEVFDAMCGELHLRGKSPGLSRRNVIVEGTDLNSLIGEEFEIQSVRFRGAAECTPCYWMDSAFAAGAEKFLRNCGGLRAQILTSGKLRVDV